MTVIVEPHAELRVLRMSRPEARNAMNTAMLMALLDGLADAVADDGVRGVVLTGDAGSFSAGADLREELDRDGQVRRMDLFCQLYEAVGTCPKPTVAAIEGHCVGGGIEVAAACDLRVADTTARFRFPGAALGIPVGAAKLVGLVGLGTAKDLVLTSRTFDAEEALRIGFAQRLAEAGSALEGALEVAGQIAANNLDAVRYLKRQFLAFSGSGDRIAAENDALHAVTESGGDYAALTMPDPKAAWLRGAGKVR
ncbi:MAG TPA: enoyl-CoA hydratase/isomerase family protein [Egibacteraceae bacterium]|nr:enoyl-CoA hydratase/isomerase family protein [Egibacteraceae bacterium]